MRKEPLKDKVFVFTGDMRIGRDDAKMQVVMLGGRCTTAPSSRTTFLVAGENPGPSKIQKAKDLRIKVLDEQEFLKLVERHSKDFDDMTEVNVRPSPKEGCSLNKDTGETFEEIMQSRKQNYMWNEKYRPRDRNDLIGNIGLITQLEDYLQGRTKYKAALLSGQPGIGKTTAAHLTCKDLGYDVVEFNASDVRSRSEISSKIGNFVNSRSVCGDAGLKKRVIIMDEIDGMTSDRGGIPELTSMIKTANVPIICICNDRNNPKIRTLSNHCLDLRFRKLDARQIFPRIKHILQQEGKQLPDGLINELILRSGGDIRYMINAVQNLVLRKTISSHQAEIFVRKNVMKSVFDVAMEVFQRKSIEEKTNLYFEDYSLIPLFVSENFLKMSFKSPRDLHECCNFVSLGDVIERLIRGPNQEWSLAPLHAIYSTVMPTRAKVLTKRMDFPSWLGQNSRHSKLQRILHLISVHSSDKVRMESSELRKYGLELMAKKHAHHLEMENISAAIVDIVEYDLIKEDINGMYEIIPGSGEWIGKAGRKAKLALDREYKKLRRKLPYSVFEEIKEDESSDENEEYQ